MKANTGLQVSSIDEFAPIDSGALSVSAIQLFIQEHSFDKSREPDPADMILFYNGQRIGSKSNVVMLTGPAKSRKSVMLSAMKTSIFNEEGFLGFKMKLNPDDRVLDIDTEQGYSHYYECMMRMLRDANLDDIPERFKSIHTREADPELNLAITEYLLETLRPAVIFIDGITDYMYDINNHDETKKVGGRILQWTSKYNCLIIAVIHTTKSTGYMTGAFGTFWEKKCETTIKVVLDEKYDEYSHVSCQMSRNKKFPTFTITFDEEKGQYVRLNETDISKKGRGGSQFPEGYHDDIHNKILNAVFLVRTFYSLNEFKIELKKKIKDVTGDDIPGKGIINWVDYYNSRVLVYQLPDTKEWARVGTANPQTSIFEQASEQHQGSNEVDDLPF